MRIIKTSLIIIAILFASGLNAEQNYWYLGQNRGLVKLQDGTKLFVDTQDVGIVGHLIAEGYWEAWIEKVVRKLVKNGDIVIEVGANNGYYTALLAKAIGQQGRLYSFEGNPRLAKLVQDSINFNGLSSNATIQNNLVSDVFGEKLKFAFDSSYSGGGHIIAAQENVNQDTHQIIEIESVTLDIALKDVNKVNLIKMDAEGAELKILSGAKRILDSNPDIIIIMEWAVNMLSAHSDVQNNMERMASQGYKFWYINYESKLVPVNTLELMKLPHCDIVISKENLNTD